MNCNCCGKEIQQLENENYSLWNLQFIVKNKLECCYCADCCIDMLNYASEQVKAIRHNIETVSSNPNISKTTLKSHCKTRKVK